MAITVETSMIPHATSQATAFQKCTGTPHGHVRVSTLTSRAFQFSNGINLLMYIMKLLVSYESFIT